MYYVQKPGRNGAAPAAAAGYLPADTLLLFAIPDPGQTADNWRTTDLYKIWAEPDVQAFMAKPLALIPPDKHRDDAIAQIEALQPKNVFIAITALDEKNNQPRGIAGFQFKGASSDVDHLIAPAKDAFRQKFPAGKADLVNYQGHAVETFATGDGKTVASVYVGDWYLIANDVALLEATVDRLDRRPPAAGATLDKDGLFQAVSAKLSSGYETLIYVRAQPLVERLMALAAASGQPVNEDARTQMAKVQAFGASTKIENGKLRDTIYTLAPGMPQDSAHLKMGSVALTSADTLFYLAQVFHVPKQIALPPDNGPNVPGPNPAAIFKAFQAQLQARGLTIPMLRAAFGNEGAFQLDWTADHPQPTAVWSLNVKNHDAAVKVVAGLTSAPLGKAVWDAKQAGVLTLHGLTIPNIDAVKPTLALTGTNLIIGLNSPSVSAAAARESSAAPNFTQSEAYKTAVADVEKPNQAFAYLDSRTLFERVYAVAKPAVLMGAAFLYPQVNNYVDLSKLPPAEVISKHLSPTVMSDVLDPQGQLVESTGSVTMFQAGIGVLSASLAAAVPILQSKYAGMLFQQAGAAAAAPGMGPNPGPPASASPAPGATP